MNEEQRRGKRAHRPPLAEYDGGERDKSAAVGHPIAEDAELNERQVSARNCRKGAADRHSSVANFPYADACRIERKGLIASCAQADPEDGMSKHDRQDRDQCEGYVGQDILGKERADDRDIGQI
jgi:hypothetical protein